MKCEIKLIGRSFKNFTKQYTTGFNLLVTIITILIVWQIGTSMSKSTYITESIGLFTVNTIFLLLILFFCFLMYLSAKFECESKKEKNTHYTHHELE